MSSREITSTEIVVIGAGAVGASIAFHLASRGRDIVLLDKGPVCGETSSATFGLIWVHSKEPAHYTRLSLLSSELWPVVVAELDEDVEFRRDGGLLLALSQKELDILSGFVTEQAKVQGLDIRLLDGETIRRMEPAVSPSVVGGSFCAQDGHVNAIAYVNALARLAQKRGARVMPFTLCRGILRDGHGAVAGVETSGGVIRCNTVVNAAGVWSAQVAHMVDVVLPIVPCRGQILVTEPLPPLVSRPLHTLLQSPSTGVIFAGQTSEFVGLDRGTTLSAFQCHAQRAMELIPVLGQALALRMFSGLRPWPPDGLPFMGAVPRVPGFYVAVGHSGITLSPIYGKVISELIVDGKTNVPIQNYNPSRYEGRDEISFVRFGETMRLDMRNWPAAAFLARPSAG
jgi:sarcosine oxidase subunit beta